MVPDQGITVSSGRTVGVVVTTYNHASFLAAALASIAAQTRRADAVVVVDDGSSDDPARVVQGYPGVQLIRQHNQGLAAARNAGLAVLATDYAIFLDADDCLEPCAIAAGLACFDRMPACGFVYGGHRYIDRDGAGLGERYEPPGADPYTRLLRRNFIAMHGTVMYRREALRGIGGFDATLRRCEDYDVYLRMAQRFPIAGYADLVAAYRLHDGNMSRDHRAMLDAALAVHARHRPTDGANPVLLDAWREGRRAWRRYYAGEAAMARYESRQAGMSLGGSLSRLAGVANMSPEIALREVWRGARHRVLKGLPSRRRVRFGDLGGTEPISRDFGFDRGTPIDRYYIERFLERHASEIVGRVLEIGGDDYTRRFGGARVTRADVLHVRPGNPRATIVGDLTDPLVLPSHGFDCIVLTQTLHLIYDVRAAVSQLHRALAPGGVVLVTVPGISQIDRGEWGSSWFWSFTTMSLKRLFAECFGPDEVLTEHHGNVFAATAFLQGLAVEEVQTAQLDPLDRSYPVIVGARARKGRRG
jgi:glycosyltransferase involved in cell wall biosynthesis